MNKYLIPTTVVLLLSACSSYNEDNPLAPVESERSVLIYMAAENNLSSFADINLEDIELSSKSLKDNQNLIVYVDKYGITGRRYSEVGTICLRFKAYFSGSGISSPRIGTCFPDLRISCPRSEADS